MESEGETSVVFCGDFNSTPETAAVRHCLGETIEQKDLAFYSSGKAGVYKIDKDLEPALSFKMGVQPIPGFESNLFLS